MRQRILLVDDDQDFAKRVSGALEGVYEIDVCNDAASFEKRFEAMLYDLVIMDMRLPEGVEGLQLVKFIVERNPLQPVVIVTAYASTETYMQAIEAGALTYLDKQEFTPALIARVVENLLRQGHLEQKVAMLERQLLTVEPTEFIGASRGATKVRQQLRLALEHDDKHVLLVGERGVGKELIARSLQQLSAIRQSWPFLIVRAIGNDSGAQSAELFGSERPSLQADRGKIEEVGRGVIYLEDVDRIQPETWQRLVRSLHTRLYQRDGGKRKLALDARFVFSMSSVPLKASVQDSFRRDLVTFANCFEIDIPSLIERAEDIPLLALYFLQHLFRQGRTTARSFTGDTVAQLQTYHWPGQVDELRVVIEYAAVQARVRGDIEVRPRDLTPEIGSPEKKSGSSLVGGHYQLHLARAEVGLVESTARSLGIYGKAGLAQALGYNDRYTFSRRINRAFQTYPQLREEFPLLVERFFGKGIRRGPTKNHLAGR